MNKRSREKDIETFLKLSKETVSIRYVAHRLKCNYLTARYWINKMLADGRAENVWFGKVKFVRWKK